MGRRPRIDRAAVLAASLAVADRAGLEALTMQAVAEQLGVTSMALYRHVANKADLLDGVVESLLTEFPLPDPSIPWRARLRELSRCIRQTAQRHPSVFPLLLTRPAATPVALRMRGAVQAALLDAGVPPHAVARTERLLSTAVLGFAASEAGGRFRDLSEEELDADFAYLERVLEGLLDGFQASPIGGVAGAVSRPR